ncbi:MAG: hypothetical protein AAFR61_14050 [Bacteroidota bacterium]
MAENRVKRGTKGTTTVRQKLNVVGSGVLILSVLFASMVKMENLEGPFTDPEKVNLQRVGSFSEGLAQAEESQKLFLVRFFTDFCFPCTLQDEWYQADLDLEDLVDASFISYEVNAGDPFGHGISLARQYNISHFPSMLVLDGDGTEVGRIEKLLTPDEAWHKLENFLQKGDPKPTDGKISSRSDTEDIWLTSETMLKEETGEDASFTLQSELVYGLRVGSFSTWDEAYNMANIRSRHWNREIWIESKNGRRFHLILGRFPQRKDAQITRAYLKNWEDESSKILVVNAQSVVLP